MFGCPTAVAFWGLGVAPASVFSASVLELWNMPLPPLISQRHRAVFLMLCCWNLWKHRNAVVFDAQRPCLRRLLRTCAEDARLWAHRLPADDASIPESWCSIFSPCNLIPRAVKLPGYPHCCNSFDPAAFVGWHNAGNSVTGGGTPPPPPPLTVKKKYLSTIQLTGLQ
jgi:hypothetical protein